MKSINNTPYVSVVMAVFNAEGTLGPAIESILSQAFDDFEFIIIDDASQDNSWNLLCQIEDPRVIILKNKENLGLTKSLNLAIEKARGKLIARMDADDISDKKRLSKQVDLMQAKTEIDVCGSWFKVFSDSYSKPILEVKHPTSHDEIILFASLYNTIGHPTVLFKKSCWEKIKYDESLQAAQDYKLWYDFYREGYRFENIPEFLVLYRQHEKTITVQKAEIQLANAAKVKVAYMKRIFPLLCGIMRMDEFFLGVFERQVAESTINRFLYRIYTKLIKWSLALNYKDQKIASTYLKCLTNDFNLRQN